MYDIIDISDCYPNDIEPIGAKRKFWYYDNNDKPHMFKEGRSGTGDNWSEKVSSELCDLIDLPHVPYELASYRGADGVISPMFYPRKGRLIHGNELLINITEGYRAYQNYGVEEYTVNLVMAVLHVDRIRSPIGWQAPVEMELACDVFVGYLMFDAWIGNQDRHHQNWALVVTPDKLVYLAPTYDHAAGLARLLNDEQRRQRIETRDRRQTIDAYAQKVKSAFYSADSGKIISTFDAFEIAMKMRPNSTAYWLNRLRNLSESDIEDVLKSVPESLLSSLGVNFTFKYLDINRKRLLQKWG